MGDNNCKNEDVSYQNMDAVPGPSKSFNNERAGFYPEEYMILKVALMTSFPVPMMNRFQAVNIAAVKNKDSFIKKK